MSFIIGLDTETTGVDALKGDKVIEFCGHVYRWSDRKRLINLNQRISNEGQKINRKAQEVHGISASDLIGKPMFKDFAPKLSKIMARKPIVVAHNAMFDMTFLAVQMKQAGLPLPPDLIIFDTMSEGMTTSYDAKSPSLREFCWAMGVDYDPALAHAAEYDVNVMMEAFFIAVDRGHFTLPETFTQAEAA